MAGSEFDQTRPWEEHTPRRTPGCRPLREYEIEDIGIDHPALLAGNFEACAVARCRENGEQPWQFENHCRGLPTGRGGIVVIGLTWRPATEANAAQAERSYQANRLTEDAAIGVCAAAFAALAEGAISEVTQHGEGADYWVDDRRAVLEVSGIRKRSSDTLEDRHADKERQLEESSLRRMGYPGYVFVVAFGEKRAIMSYRQ